MPMTAQPRLDAAGEHAEFVDLLSQQLELYQELSRLTQEQKWLIQADEVEAMVAVLNQRRKIIDQLNITCTQLAPLRQRWEQGLPAVDPATREQVQAIVAQVQQLVAQIVKQDEEGRRALEIARNEKAKQLRHTVKSNRAMRAYTPQSPAAAPPRFMDSQG